MLVDAAVKWLKRSGVLRYVPRSVKEPGRRFLARWAAGGDRLVPALIGRRASFSCPICDRGAGRIIAEVAGHTYALCSGCGSISIERETIERLDAGGSLVEYDQGYWANELPAARERAFGHALARMSEAIHYARVPISRFLDVGSGPGFFLDAVARYLPSRKEHFFGVEKFPPPPEQRTSSPNFFVGDVADLAFRVDGGICIEVAEHLTPKTLRGLLAALAKVSTPGALFVFNSGMPEYVLKDDLAYLDPKQRGHIVSYSLDAVRLLSRELGFTVLPIRGKTWAYVLEFQSSARANEDVRSRIWSAKPENLELLTDPEMGSVLRILGLETARAYQ